jgi:hypothetical protein
MSKFIIYALTTLSLLNISFALPVEIIQGDIAVTKVFIEIIFIQEIFNSSTLHLFH